MRRFIFLVGVMVILGLFVSPAYAGGKVGVESKSVVVTESISQPKVEVANASFAQAVKAYFSTRVGFWFIKSEVKGSTKPNEPQKDWGSHSYKEYISIRDNGGTPIID